MEKLKYLSLVLVVAMCTGFVSCDPEPDPEPVQNQPMPGENVAEEVDLGLSVKWASWNIGANSPEDCGGYYAFGEIEEKEKYYFYNYAHSQVSDYDTYVHTDLGDISGSQYDVASKRWGATWRMPSREEMEELVNKCEWKWISFKGVRGCKVVGPNGNSIFIPASGFKDDNNGGHKGTDCVFIMSSTPSKWMGSDGYVYVLFVDSDGCDPMVVGGTNLGYKASGHCVRAVKN